MLKKWNISFAMGSPPISISNIEQIRRINQLLSSLKQSESRRFSDNFRWNSSHLIGLNRSDVRGKTLRQSPAYLCLLFYILTGLND